MMKNENSRVFDEVENISKINSYTTDFICTYKMIDDDYNDSLLLYKMQLLQAFDLLEFNDAIINKITESLYEKYKDNEYMSKIIESKSSYLDDKFDSNLDIFRLCFGYNTFNLMHAILCSLENNKEINNKHYEELLKISF